MGPEGRKGTGCVVEARQRPTRTGTGAELCTGIAHPARTSPLPLHASTNATYRDPKRPDGQVSGRLARGLERARSVRSTAPGGAGSVLARGSRGGMSMSSRQLGQDGGSLAAEPEAQMAAANFMQVGWRRPLLLSCRLVLQAAACITGHCLRLWPSK